MKTLLYFFICLSSFIWAQKAEIKEDIVEVGSASEITITAPLGCTLLGVAPTEQNKWTLSYASDIDTFATEIQWTSQIVVLDTGNITVGPFLFLQNQDTLRSNVLSIIPKDVDIDTSLAIKDIAAYAEPQLGVLDYVIAGLKWSFKHWYFTFLPVGIALALFLYLLARKKKEIKEIIPSLSIYEQLLQKVADLKNQNLLAKEQYHSYYFELTYLIRWFLEEEFKQPMLNKTNEESAAALTRMNINDHFKQPLKAIFENSILIKFAKQIADQKTAESDLIIFEKFIQHQKNKQDSNDEER